MAAPFHFSHVQARIAAGVMVIAVAGWLLPRVRHSSIVPPRTAHPEQAPVTPRVVTSVAIDSTPGDDDPRAASAKPTREETLAYLTRSYRREQLSREFDLDQRRYGLSYWNYGPTGAERAAITEERDALVRQLTAEANEILGTLFPGEPGGRVELTPLFGDDRPGPNVGFLSPALRQKFEAALFSANRLDPDHLLDLALDFLPAAEAATYRQWNEPATAALRQLLVGFGATEGEFLAILHDGRGAVDRDDDIGIESGLETQLGPARYAAFIRLKDPAIQTAVHDLQRLGLPLENADWLAATRERAVAAIQQVWQDPQIPAASKPDEVSAVRRSYGQAIAARLSLRGATLGDIGAIH